MRAAVPIACALLVAGCGGATSDPGLSADLRIAGAQFVRGALPAASGGPGVVGVHLADPNLHPGDSEPLLGELAPEATAVAIGLDGDRGYWVVPAGVPDSNAPTLPTFDVTLSLARTAAAGMRTLAVRAVDVGGRFGDAATVPLAIAERPAPSGRLVIHLEWDTDADLDLHVIDPTGVEIWSGHPSAYHPPPPPALPDPTAAAEAAQLDADSNAQCRIDGRDQENVIYTEAPPAGRYTVRVETWSLCGAPLADWRVAAISDGAPIATADGTSYPDDTRGTHGAGAGRTALVFTLP